MDENKLFEQEPRSGGFFRTQGFYIMLALCLLIVGTAVALTALEFDLLAFLARNPDMVFSYEQLYDRVWKAPMNQGLHNIQVCMARVRQKLDALSPGVHWIETVRRKGYRFNSSAGT